jgi:hypothetical protein
VAGHAHSGNGNPTDENPITDETTEEGDPFARDALIPQVKEPDGKIADGDPLQHAVEAHMRKVKVGEAVDDDTEQNQDNRADDRVLRKLRARCTPGEACVGREDDGDTNDEDERGKDQVSGCEAIPVGVVHEVPRARAAIVVDHDHEGDGDAADHVEGKKSLDGIAVRRTRNGCRCRIDCGDAWIHRYPEEKLMHLNYALEAGCAK